MCVCVCVWITLIQVVLYNGSLPIRILLCVISVQIKVLYLVVYFVPSAV